MPRMRVVKWLVQPVVMVDDGEHLTEVQVEATAIPAASWEEWTMVGWRAAVEDLQNRVTGVQPAVPSEQGSAPA